MMAPPDLLAPDGADHGWRRAAPAPRRDPASRSGTAPSSARSTRMTPSRTSRLLLTAAAAVVVIAGIKAASDIVGPLVLALSLTIVFHPMRVRLERGCRRGPRPSSCWSAPTRSSWLLIVSLVVAIGQPRRAGPVVRARAQRLRGGRRGLAGGRGRRAATRSRPPRTRPTPAGWSGSRPTCCPSILAILSNLFFLVALLLFLAFDSAKVSDLAAGAREEHAALRGRHDLVRPRHPQLPRASRRSSG